LSLASIISDALSEIGGGVSIPSSIVGNSDPTAVKALAMCRSIGKDLMRSYQWPTLKQNYAFQTVPNQEYYACPPDFRRFSPMTHWDRTSHWPLMGAATDAFWGLLKSGFVTFGMRFWFRIENGQLAIAPTPTDIRTLAFDYYSNTWAAAADGTPQSTFLADTDTVRFTITAAGNVSDAEDLMKLGLMYKWKASNGLPYDDDKANYLDAIQAESFDASPPPLIDVTGIPRNVLTKGLIPDTNFGH
jgi:hypothetical protein